MKRKNKPYDTGELRWKEGVARADCLCMRWMGNQGARSESEESVGEREDIYAECGGVGGPMLEKSERVEEGTRACESHG